MTQWLITGANRGIGLELCRRLQARGEGVIAVCRSTSPELEALGVQVEAGMDSTAGAELRRLGNLVEIAQTLPVWERPGYLLERMPQALLSPDLQKSR
ncbi:MAG: hypothetical protein ACK486_12655, partial [Cyanobacteriota bacterium]